MSTVTFQTVKRDSVFTRLDFRPKLFMVVVVTAVAFMWESPITGGAMTLLLTVGALAVGVRWKYIRTIYMVMIFFGLLLILTHGFFNKEQVLSLTGRESLTPLFTIPDDWFLIGGGLMSFEGTLYGFNALFKTLTMVLVIPIAIFTTDVNRMIIGMVKAKIPYKLTFIFSSTLRFFPLLFDEIHTIIEAQRLRGLPMEKMGPVKRVKVYAKVAIPLILTSMVESQMIEVVLQSKAFTGSPDRTYLHESLISKEDVAMFTFFGLFLVIATVSYFVWGVGRFAWLLF
ncbi:MAG: energy-coupling factor transporter transmembrane component T family protein [Spirochaetaceae bacterium]